MSEGSAGGVTVFSPRKGIHKPTKDETFRVHTLTSQPIQNYTLSSNLLLLCSGLASGVDIWPVLRP